MAEEEDDDHCCRTDQSSGGGRNKTSNAAADVTGGGCVEDDEASDLRDGGCAGEVDDEARSIAEVGASERGKWTSAATATVGVLQAQLLKRFVILTPPPLLADVFPWDRDGESSSSAESSFSSSLTRPASLMDDDVVVSGAVVTEMVGFWDGSMMRRKRQQCAPKSSDEIRICDGWMVLTPIEKLDLQVMLQAQYDLDQKASKMKFTFFFPAQSMMSTLWLLFWSNSSSVY
ncbi:hypothetical protein PIB30_047103 [Stylosanthes scabra]|uniref:Uncharacterized protein n=1 Tax=Stylosanthes scabra TaxID=79078 RepID=A0ABU6ZFD6_9FABA|nr:hypothetical protein [Stylosanthes scabra]